MRRDPKTSSSNNSTKRGINSNVMNYVNSSIFSDVVENNIITTIFQNDARIRTGKFIIPKVGEMSTKLVIQALSKLKMLKYNVKIVPVCITYERIWEASYLANEMISGRFKNINSYELWNRVSSTRPAKLGKQIVKYCDPFDLNDFVNAQKKQTTEYLSKKLS